LAKIQAFLQLSEKRATKRVRELSRWWSKTASPHGWRCPKNVFDGRIDIEDVLTMPMTDEQFAHFRVRRGDVLLNEGQSLELVGRCSLYLDEYPGPSAMQNQLLRFRARKGVCPVFASYLFRYCQQTGVFARHNTFNLQRHLVSRSTLRIFRAEVANQWQDAVAAV
jgi:hypothetical protein